MVRIDRDRSGRILLLCWVAYTASYITRLGLSNALPEMVASGVLSKTLGGTLGTGFFAVYGLGQLINGFLADRFSPRRMIALGLVGSGICNLTVSALSSGAALMAVWCVNGYCCSMLWAPVIRSLAIGMTEDKAGRAGVWIASAIPCGGILANLLGAGLLAIGSWRLLFGVAGVIGLAVAAVWTAFMPPLENKKASVEGRPAAQKAPFWSVFFSCGVMFAVGAVFFNGILKDGLTLWMPTLLTERFNISASHAALIALVLPLINLGGAFVARALDTKLKNEYATTAVMFAVAAAALIPLAYLPRFAAPLTALCAACCTSSMLGANNMLLTYIPLNFRYVGRAASITGFLDACSYLASALSGVAVGAMSENLGWVIVSRVWVLVAVFGGTIALLGVRMWNKKRKKLSQK